MENIKMYNLADIKDRHNIVDVIGQYVTLRKSGKEYKGCCPFHDEKTPSFTVSEDKQVFYCFGCGATGDVIDFVSRFSGISFVAACKALGAESNVLPTEKVKQNLQRAASKVSFNLPCDDKRDPQMCAELLSGCSYIGIGPINYYEDPNCNRYTPLTDWHGEIVNLYTGFDFISGGISYGSFTPIRVKKNDNYMLCVDTLDAVNISKKYNVNVLICYTDHNLKYVVKSAPKSAKVLPVITENDDDFLCYEGEWLSYKNDELKKEEIKNV